MNSNGPGLTEVQKANLRSIDRAIRGMPPEFADAQRAAGRQLADTLRTQLSDLDDVTIGRVVLEIGGFIAALSDAEQNLHLTNLANQICCAGMDFTAMEWHPDA